MFEQRLVDGWGDLDFNAHMRNTAFLDKSADVRMMFFAEHGFPVAEFARRRIGPGIMKDETEQAAASFSATSSGAPTRGWPPA
jgi:acyl-CoA thioester hydrolase